MSSPLLDQILADIKTAMKARASDTLTALRSLHAQVKDASVNAGKEATDDVVSAVVGKAIKQRRDSIEQYVQANREDLADKERREVDLFAKYQPEQLTEEEIEALTRNAIAESGAQGKQEMGKVMKLLMPQVKNRADGKVVNAVVQRLLSS